MKDVLVINKNFGPVLCGQEVSETFKIENTTKETQVFVVVPLGRDVPELFYERLQVYPLKATAQPGKCVRFKLTYISYIENRTDNYSYHICNCEKIVAQVHVHAQAVGPSLTPAVHNVKFFWCRDVHQNVKNIEIVNTTKCEAKYYFDIDEDYQMIQISQKSGVLPGGTKLNLKLTFNPSEPGFYYKQIFCIVQYHKPIVFNIMGIYKPKLRLEPKNVFFKYPPQPLYLNSYDGYLAKPNPENYPEKEEKKPLPKCVEDFSICLDEASREEEEEEEEETTLSLDDVPQSKSKLVEKVLPEVVLLNNYINLNTQSEFHNATVLVNVSKYRSYAYEWSCDQKRNFHVEPCRGIVEPDERITFSVFFMPSCPNLLYHVELDVHIYPYEPDIDNSSPSVYLPLTMSLRILGSSFPADSCGWVSQCSLVPKVLQLPSCVPGETVYGTFLIQRRGHLPSTFAVLPPKDQNYSIQPPLGYFSTNFKLLVVQFSAKLKEKRVYNEDLKIAFNNSESAFDVIKLSTTVEIPELIIGDNNSYQFDPTLPLSKTLVKIPIKNPTTLFLSYEFKVAEDINWVEIFNPSGTIEPMSQTEIEVLFKPEIPFEYLNYIQCLVSSISMPEYVETVNLRLVGSCQFGNIIATPSIYDFGECLYKTKKTLLVHLYNFSSTRIHFRLNTVHRAFPIGDPQKDVKITPIRGCVPAKGSLPVKVTVKPHNLDLLQYGITCQNLENDAEDALPCEEPRIIFSFVFEGVLPGFQIIDLSIDAGGPLFSPHWVWKMMCINRINQALYSMTPENEVDMNLPEAVADSPPIVIALLIESNRHGHVMWKSQSNVYYPSIKDSKASSSIREMFCQEKAFTVIPSKVKLGPKKRVIVKLVLNYRFPDECIIYWTIHLPYKRTVTIKTSLVSLPVQDLSFTSMYLAPRFSLKPVYVGDLKPPLQLFWLYNNTQKPTSYFADMVTLHKDTESVSRIFDCINPSGVIPPFSCVPLVFLFKPNEIKWYSVEVSLCLHENRTKTITLKGEGVPTVQQMSERVIQKTLPEKPILYNTSVALEMSVNFISLYFLRTFSQIKRIFYIQNRSETDQWSFQWHSFRAENLIKAKIEPESGVINPCEKKPMILTVESLCHPTQISFSIPCDVINYTLLLKHEAYLRCSEEISEKCKDYFTITEKGISYEVPEIPVVVKPEGKHLFLAVNANVISELNLDQKLSLNEQIKLKAGSELQHSMTKKCRIQSSMLPSIQLVIEKVLWDILEGRVFEQTFKTLAVSHDYNYLHILPGSMKNTEEIMCRSLKTPSKTYIQNFLEKTIQEILYQKLGGGDSEFNAQLMTKEKNVESK